MIDQPNWRIGLKLKILDSPGSCVMQRKQSDYFAENHLVIIAFPLTSKEEHEGVSNA